MNQEDQYNHIRPYRDHEVPDVIEKLMGNPLISELLGMLFPDTPADVIRRKLREISTVFSFQTEIIYPAFKRLLHKTSDGFTYHGLESLDPDAPYLFISNHVDISLDPMLMDFALYEKGFDTMEIAIGDNLVGEDWIRDLVRLNKSFIVHRNLPRRALVEASRTLSEYISYTINGRRQSVWIAQREGRAKDGNHKTQPGILHMLAMASNGSILDHYRQLNIVPVSISYELDPCGADKVRSMYAERYGGGYIKKQGEDHLAMKKGILGQKGRIHLEFGEPLNRKLQSIPSMSKQDLIQAYCSAIDEEILARYRLFESNYVAADIMNASDHYSDCYTDDYKERFIGEIERRLAQIDGDERKLRDLFLEKYARPVMNYEALQKQMDEKRTE